MKICKKKQTSGRFCKISLKYHGRVVRSWGNAYVQIWHCIRPQVKYSVYCRMPTDIRDTHPEIE